MNIGIAQYVGVHDTEVDFLYNTLGELEGEDGDLSSHYEKLLNKAYQLGNDF
ncbi:hypothetical protein D3C74_491500 [compost metagenome]